MLALIRLENGRQITAKLHQLSVTGGLLHLDKPLDEAIKIEIIFHVASGTIRNKAVMLFPMWATQGCLQPFEFLDLDDAQRRTLQNDLEQLLDAMKQGRAVPTVEEVEEVVMDAEAPAVDSDRPDFTYPS